MRTVFHLTSTGSLCFALKEKTTNHLLAVYEMDEDHLKTMGYVMESGKFFSPGTTIDKNEIILNQTAAKKMGIKSWQDVKVSSNYDTDTLTEEQ